MEPRPLYIDSATCSTFAWFHPSCGDVQSGRAVIMCPPWGWDEVASYRGRRRWAEALASDGFGVLRFDLPGTGDSAGDPLDGDQVERWVQSIRDGTDWLLAQPRITSVCVLGLGLGGLLALRAIEGGARVDDIVVWSVYQRGRRFTRACRAFAGTQSSRAAADAPRSLPPGWMDVNGFVLRADTLASLDSLDASSMSTGTLRRALLLDQDGVSVDGAFVEHLRRQRIDVRQGDGAGWSELAGHPERCELPVAVVEQVRDWLAEVKGTVMAQDSEATSVGGRSRQVTEDGRVIETPTEIDSPNGRLFAIVTDSGQEPVGSGACAVFFNAGAVRRVGPNRLWVTLARRWAARGIASIRVDVPGIGDGAGTDTHPDGVEALYASERIDEIRAALCEARRRWPGRRVVAIGLCAGGYWAFRAAQLDDFDADAVVLNPGALVWRSDTAARHRARRIANWRDPAVVRRLVRGEVRKDVVVSALRGCVGVARALPLHLRARWQGTPSVSVAIRRALDDVRRSGSQLTLAFSSGEEVERELAKFGVLDDLDRWPTVVHHTLPGGDHTLRPPEAQSAIIELFDTIAADYAEQLAP